MSSEAAAWTGAELEGKPRWARELGLGLWGDGEGTVRTGGFGTLWQVELWDGNSVGVAWTATVAKGRGGAAGRAAPSAGEGPEDAELGLDSTGHREAHGPGKQS